MKTLVCHKARLILVILSLQSEPFQISSKSLLGPTQEDLLETSLINDTKPQGLFFKAYEKDQLGHQKGWSFLYGN